MVAAGLVPHCDHKKAHAEEVEIVEVAVDHTVALVAAEYSPGERSLDDNFAQTKELVLGATFEVAGGVAEEDHDGEDHFAGDADLVAIVDLHNRLAVREVGDHGLEDRDSEGHGFEEVLAVLFPSMVAVGYIQRADLVAEGVPDFVADLGPVGGHCSHLVDGCKVLEDGNLLDRFERHPYHLGAQHHLAAVVDIAVVARIRKEVADAGSMEEGQEEVEEVVESCTLDLLTFSWTRLGLDLPSRLVSRNFVCLWVSQNEC